jgi:DNA polymerase-1
MAARYGQDRANASTEANSYWFKEFTTTAVERGELRIVSLTPSNNPQWTKGNLNRLTRSAATREVAQLILDNRRSTKRAQYLRSWLYFVTPAGLIHSTFHPGRVVTGRLSSSDPNMQQVNKELKTAFPARPGMAIIEFDYSQIELRIAAFIARCLPMIQAFRDGKDVHRMLAALLNKIAEDLVTPAQRQNAKAGNFGLLYEMSAEGFRLYAEDKYDVVLSSQQALEMHTAFFDLWEGLREWHEESKRKIHRDGFITSPLGRVRRLPGIWDSNPGMRGFAERAGINAPVQSMASDVMQIAAASIQGLLPDRKPAVKGVFMLGTVHDSIVLECPINQVPRVVAECKERMEVTVLEVLRRLGVEFDVPLIADATIGTRWGSNDLQHLLAGEEVAA